MIMHSFFSPFLIKVCLHEAILQLATPFYRMLLGHEHQFKLHVICGKQHESGRFAAFYKLQTLRMASRGVRTFNGMLLLAANRFVSIHLSVFEKLFHLKTINFRHTHTIFAQVIFNCFEKNLTK